eukprot:5750584-Prymnesium_polylepis.1
MAWRQLSQEGVRTRACDPARRFDGSRPRNRAWRTFLSGKRDDARDGAPAHARPHARTSPRVSLRRARMY